MRISLSPPVQGILWMLAATALFSCTNTLAKVSGQSLDIVQVVWARYAFHFVFMVMILRGQTLNVLKTEHLSMQLSRSTLLLIASMLYFTGFTFLPLADSAAMINVTPVLVTILSALLLREVVGIRRWISVLIGFAGALVVIRPGLGSFTDAAFYPLAAALAYGLYQIATRHVSHSDSPMTSVIYTALAGTVIGSFVVPFFWVSPNLIEWSMMIGLGITGALGHYFMIRAYSITEISVAAPFAYVVIIWMTIMGYVVFGDLPDVWTIVGAITIVGSGLYIAKRERLKSEIQN